MTSAANPTDFIDARLEVRTTVEFLESRPADRDDVVVVRVAGEVDSASSEHFRERLVGVLDKGVTHVIADLADLTYINSSGLGALVAAYKRVRAVGGTLKLCNVRGSIAEVMKLIRLDKIIDIYDNEEEALASL